MAHRNAPRVETFGCRLNIWESEVVRDQAATAGLNDAIIFNTCAVTAEAERQARQAIRRARRDDPDARIIVTGCAAQIAPETWDAMPEVDHVVGNHDKLTAPAWQSLAAGGEAIIVSDVMQVRETATHMLDAFSAHTRGFLQIQQGCDHRCTFCIIPYGRGNNRSAGLGQILEAAGHLVDGGCAEIVLTGVDITSWGSDLPGRPRLGDLVGELLRSLPRLQRLRLSSLDPAEPDSQLMDVLASESRLMPHLHLSAQHGDDTILKRMKRRHLGRDVVRFCDEARRRRPDVVFGADLIAGFPTESDAAHDATLRLIDRAGLTYLHVFPFSPRAGTPAARMPQLDGRLVRQRADALRARGGQRLEGFLDNVVGSHEQLLVESGNAGHGRNFAKMRLAGDMASPGELLDVRVLERDGQHLKVVRR
ncbi:MAG: tRNA (N(6)-L-threonylcarbamoyladenosine(37)-C(2))-methylthiotransferase MtaB [Candidatus Puniceispirillaceae bacterium]|jgi:threonylcarbamoyladenosine tRNA methylthiotransferase MtaB